MATKGTDKCLPPFIVFILYYAFFPEGFSSFFSSVWSVFFSSGFSVFSGFSSLSTLPSKASSKVASNLVLFKSSSLFSFSRSQWDLRRCFHLISVEKPASITSDIRRQAFRGLNKPHRVYYHKHRHLATLL